MAEITAYTQKGKAYKISASDEIHRGGEGRIMAIKTNPDIVAKLYHDGIFPITKEQFDFLSKLNSKEAEELFVRPLDLLFNKKKQIIGFTMKYLGQDYFPISAIFSKNFCLQNDINQYSKIKFAEKIIRAICYAHQNKLVIGDLNQYNILITKQGDLKLIDVDSYQTPFHPHSGYLLEEIRDYLYGGKISKQSDFFAFSILFFYSLTFAHPFKGIHKKYKKLSERMLHRIPIFVKDTDLKPPKCYTPINSDLLQNQFEKFYIEGERFLISLKDAKIDKFLKIKKPIPIAAIVEKDLIIKLIIENQKVKNIFFLKEKGFVETSENYQIFNSKNKGYLTSLFTIDKKDWEKIYISDKNIFVRKKDKLFHYKNNTEIIEITNFKFSENSITYQLENILIVINEDVMTWLYLDDVLNHSVRNKRTEVFSRGFTYHKGLFQNAGGILRIFYNQGKDIATVKIDKHSIKEIYQQKNIGIIQYIENKQIKNQYFKISGLNIEFSQQENGKVYDFAYMPTSKEDGFIFEPEDGKINLRKTQDFQIISELNCELITSETKLQYSESGIIAWENENIYLINKK